MCIETRRVVVNHRGENTMNQTRWLDTESPFSLYVKIPRRDISQQQALFLRVTKLTIQLHFERSMRVKGVYQSKRTKIRQEHPHSAEGICP